MDEQDILKAAQDSMNEYKVMFTQKSNELVETQEKVETLKAEINQIRGAYTSLYDLCQKMNKKTSKPEKESIKEETKQKAHRLVEKAKEQGKITPYEEFAKSELGKETAINNIEDVVDVKSLPEDVQKQIEDEKAEVKKAESCEDPSKDHIIEEANKVAEKEQTEKNNQPIDENQDGSKLTFEQIQMLKEAYYGTPKQNNTKVNEKDIPEYLKDEYKK